MARFPVTVIDSAVKLWNIDSLLKSPLEAQDSLLATLSAHTKSVNVVRWSKDGRLLASGSDDNYILVHRHTPGAIANQTFGSSNGAAKNKETWTRFAAHTFFLLLFFLFLSLSFFFSLSLLKYSFVLDAIHCKVILWMFLT
jgi:WD40 repeat protein